MKLTYTSVFLLIAFTCSLCSCGSNEHRLQVEFVFINESNNQINYSDLFTISAGGIHTIFVDGTSSTDNPKIETCCQGFLEDIQDDYFQVYMIVDEAYCVFFEENEGPTTVENFTSDILGDKYFKFTYTITESDIESMQPCDQ